MTPKRYTASTINDDALDELYANASKGWRRGDIWKQKAKEIERDRDIHCAELEQAQAAIKRVLAWCDQLDANARELTQDPTAEHPVAANVRHQLAEPKESTTP